MVTGAWTDWLIGPEDAGAGAGAAGTEETEAKRAEAEERRGGRVVKAERAEEADWAGLIELRSGDMLQNGSFVSLRMTPKGAERPMLEEGEAMTPAGVGGVD